MKKMSREKLIRRAVLWSLLQKKYLDKIKENLTYERSVVEDKVFPYGLEIIRESYRAHIQKCQKLVLGYITPLLYEDLKEPFNEKKRRTFGEISASDFIDIINEKTAYHSINYISDFELKQGYIFFNELNVDLLRVNQIGMILNLTTGEYVRAKKEEIAKCSPITLILGKLVITPENY